MTETLEQQRDRSCPTCLSDTDLPEKGLEVMGPWVTLWVLLGKEPAQWNLMLNRICPLATSVGVATSLEPRTEGIAAKGALEKAEAGAV